MPEVGNLRASLSANTAQFESDMKRAKNAVRSNAKGMESAMSRVQKKFKDASATINRFGGVAIAGAATAAAAFVKQQVNVADKMGKLAQSTGTTSEYLSSMSLVASQAGTSLEVVAKASNRLSMNMQDFRRGVGESKEAFEDLNITVADSDGVLRNTDDVMKDIADRFAGMEDGADKTALAMRLFGRAGAELIPMLNMGSAGISELQDKAEEMGLVISTKTALEAAMLNDQLDILQKSALGAGRSIALDLVPWLNNAVAAMTEAKEESGTLMAAWVGLGAIGDALYSKSTEQKLNEAKKDLADLTEGLERYKNGWESDFEAFFGFDDDNIKKAEAKIAKARADVEKYTALLKKEKAAEKVAMEASLEKQRKEADERRKNTEAMRAQAEQRLKNAQLTREQEAAEKARVREAEAARASIDAQVRAIELQAETYGMTADEVALYTLKLAGANEEQLRAAQLALADVAAKKEQASAIEKLAEQQEMLEARARSVAESVRTPMEEYQAKMDELNDLLLNTDMSHETFARAANKAWRDTVGASKAATDEMSTFVEEAARNMQDAMADGFFSIMQGEFGDLEQSFKRTIDRMVANLLSSQLNNWLFGDLGSTGSLGGVVGDIAGSFMPGEWDWLSFAGGGYTGSGARSGGLDGKGGYMAMIHPQEEIIDHTKRQRSGMQVINNISISAPDGRISNESMSQLQARLGRSMQRSLARNS